MKNILNLDKESKPITISQKDLAESNHAIVALGSLHFDADRSSYWIGKTVRQVTHAIAAGQKALRKAQYDLCKELGTVVMVDKLGADGVTTKVPSPNYEVLPENGNAEKYEQAWVEEINKTVELNIRQIQLSMLKGQRMTPADLGALEWLIVDDSDEKK